jgi:hypothetical protein
MTIVFFLLIFPLHDQNNNNSVRGQIRKFYSANREKEEKRLVYIVLFFLTIAELFFKNQCSIEKRLNGFVMRK